MSAAPADMSDKAPANVELDLERDVLGMVVVWDRLLEALGCQLEERDFWRLAHQLIWRAAVTVAESGVQLSQFAVATELRRRGQLDEVGAVYMNHLGDGIPKPSPESLRYHIARLQAYTVSREADAEMARAQAALANSPRDVGAVLAESQARIESIQTRIGREHRALDGWAQIEALVADQNRDESESVQIGFPGIDEAIPGIYPGEVCGVLARPGVGKTLLFGHVVRRNVGNGHAFFSLEMPAAQIVARVARAVWGFDRNQLKRAVTGGEMDAQAYLDATRGWLLIDAPGLSVAQIDGRVRQLVTGPLREIPLRLITVDHLGLIGGDRKLSTYDRVSTQARELKELAKRQHCAVLVAIQVNREQGGDGSRELTLGAARDSGVVEEAMDYMVALRRLDRSRDASAEQRVKFRDVIFARILKNRHGELGDEIAIRFNPVDLTVAEDPTLHAEEAELKDLISRGRGRR